MKGFIDFNFRQIRDRIETRLGRLAKTHAESVTLLQDAPVQQVQSGVSRLFAVARPLILSMCWQHTALSGLH